MLDEKKLKEKFQVAKDRKEMFISLRKSTLLSFVNDSGARYSSLVLPVDRSDLTCSISSLDKEEFMKCAIPSSAPKFLIASTWFFISEISGDTTMAVPLLINAGN